ncbi:hypothetical protein GQR58_024416 [Nymphon striatum]|nr:hypothetical protein GQR58_024416 [Nymphon striatum]
MVQCFAPDCNHYSDNRICSFFSFPKDERRFRRWQTLIRRADKEPNSNSRVCSCHFQNGDKKNDPELFARNTTKLFQTEPEEKRKRVKKMTPAEDSIHDDKGLLFESVEGPSNVAEITVSTDTFIPQSDLHNATKKSEQLQKDVEYLRCSYSVSSLKENVLRMETGLPTKKVFWILVNYAIRFRDNINYFYGWKVEGIKFEDQILITLMKLRQNYTNLHLAQLFSCSETTISNIILTFLYVLHHLLFKDLMATFPSRNKNKICSPSSFLPFPNCRIVIDCTVVEIAIPQMMNLQSATYPSYRSTNSFKALVGVSPNGAITYISKLYPVSVSDKKIVESCGILTHFIAGDLILAYEDFLIEDIVPVGVSVNTCPFLQHGKFTRSEASATKQIAFCWVHVERANARLKDFKILSFIPAWLRSHGDTIVQLIGALVNLQFPLIKEECEETVFD